MEGSNQKFRVNMYDTSEWLTNLLKNSHRCIRCQDIISLVHKHLFIVCVGIAATEVLFIEFKCLMKKCCGVFKNWK